MLMHLNCLNLRLAGYNTRSIRSLGSVIEPLRRPRRMELELPRVIECRGRSRAGGEDGSGDTRRSRAVSALR